MNPTFLILLSLLGPTNSMELPPEIRAWFDNPDGSCVQCSIGMNAVHRNNLNAAMLLWDTDYGHAERGGSTPSRVARYCDERGIPAWNITGTETIDWAIWSIKTNRYAAIGLSTRHFQTLYGREDKDTPTTIDDVWLVCDNNSTERISRYTEVELIKKHLQSGRWIVVLQGPSVPPVPQYIKWW